MSKSELHVVTGAFGYSGRYIASRLLREGKRVLSITGHPDRPDPFEGRLDAVRMSFDDPQALERSLAGGTVLYNTYWVRFDWGDASFGRAVANTKALFAAAARAGVERVVHVSITNPSLGSALPYFSGKAELEQALARSGLSHAILRPTVLFGGRDVLINNIAWLLRRLPVFGVAGDGRYQVQPIHVTDLAALAVEHGSQRDDVVLDAVGPERYRFDELVHLIARAIGSRARIVHLPPWLVALAARVMGRWLGDVVLTRQEIDGLMEGLLVSEAPPTGITRFSQWLTTHADELGRRYASELARHYR